MGKLVNIAQIKKQVQGTMNEKINGLMSELQSGDLDPENLEKSIKPYEEKFEKISQISDAISTAQTAFKAVTDPVGTAKTMAFDMAKQAIADSQLVQDLKSKAVEAINEKLDEIPQVAEAKAKIEQFIDQNIGATAVPDYSSYAQEPDLSTEAFVQRAIRESGLARMLIKTE